MSAATAAKKEYGHKGSCGMRDWIVKFNTHFIVVESGSKCIFGPFKDGIFEPRSWTQYPDV